MSRKIQTTGVMRLDASQTTIWRQTLTTELGEGERVVTLRPKKEKWEVHVAFDYTKMGQVKGRWFESFSSQEEAEARAKREISQGEIQAQA